MNLYCAYGIHATCFNVVYPEPCKLNTGKKTLNVKNTHACLRHAMGLHSIIYNSAVQFEFFLTSFPGKAECQPDKTLSALNQKSKGLSNLGDSLSEIQLDISIVVRFYSHFSLRKNLNSAGNEKEEEGRKKEEHAEAISRLLIQV